MQTSLSLSLAAEQIKALNVWIMWLFTVATKQHLAGLQGGGGLGRGRGGVVTGQVMDPVSLTSHAWEMLACK